jgi:hypothetical protein
MWLDSQPLSKETNLQFPATFLDLSALFPGALEVAGAEDWQSRLESCTAPGCFAKDSRSHCGQPFTLALTRK